MKNISNNGGGTEVDPSIVKKINRAKKSLDTDLKLEGDTASALGNKVISFRRNINGPKGRVREIDIETENCIIDCFNGESSKESAIFLKYLDEKCSVYEPRW